MFEHYLFAAKELIEDAKTADTTTNDLKAKMLYRSSIWHLSGAIEAYVNAAVAALDRTTIDPLLIAFLQDKTYKINRNKLLVEINVEYHTVEDKLNMLAKIYAFSIPKQGKIWTDFLALKELRDELMHPKQEEDLISLNRFHKVGLNGLTSVLHILELFNKKIYGRPFRKRLRELND